jgi:hypothetical protein
VRVSRFGFWIVIVLLKTPASAQPKEAWAGSSKGVRQQQFNPVLDSLVRTTLHTIYSYRFSEARTQIAQVAERDSLVAAGLLVFLLRWEYVPIQVSPESDRYRGLLEALNQSLVEKSDKTSPEKYMLISGFLFLCEYHYQKRDHFTLDIATDLREQRPALMAIVTDVGVMRDSFNIDFGHHTIPRERTNYPITPEPINSSWAYHAAN